MIKKEAYELLYKLFIIGILIGTLLVMVFTYNYNNLLTYFTTIPLVLVPWFFDKTFFKFETFDKLIYYSFVFFAYFGGGVLGLYSKLSWYDLLMHFVSGFMMGYFGMFLLRKLKMYNKNNKVFNFVYALVFAIASAGFWEIIEFSIDNVIGTNIQHSLDTGVIDTMQDIICGTVSGFIFAMIVAFGVKSKSR